MKADSYRTEDAGGLVILATFDHLRERGRPLRALHQQGPTIMGQHGRRAIAVPPSHELVACLLLRLLRDFEHGWQAALTNGKQIAVQRDESLAING
ncbi:hypothetical protein D3C79_745270 [compost metagenome]